MNHLFEFQLQLFKPISKTKVNFNSNSSTTTASSPYISYTPTPPNPINTNYCLLLPNLHPLLLCSYLHKTLLPMTLAQFPVNPICICLQFLTFITLAVSSSKLDSLYDALTSNALPIGLLPNSITEFEIDDQTGRFRVHLEQACNAKFESELHYDGNISGILSYGMISSLSGVQAQELFLWFPVKSIHVDVPTTGLIYFDVGVVLKQFSLSSFESPPDCVAAESQPGSQVMSM